MIMETTLQRQSIVKRTKDILFSRLDEELLAIDSQAGYCYSLNDTAGRVWDLIVTPLSIDAICTQLRQEFNVDEATCLREVTALLKRLCEAGLVETNNG
jgi:hypothetical protein